MVSDFQPHESYRFFLQEVPALVRELEDGILGLRQSQTNSSLWDLLRTAHSIKGGAACSGIQHIQDIAHLLETSLKAVSEADVQVDLAIEDLLLKSFDCLKQAVVAEMQSLPEDQNAILSQAQQLWSQLEDHLFAIAPQSSLGHPVDSTHMMFAEDVAQGLKRIESILTQTQSNGLNSALQAQIQVFRGVGEIANLPGFTLIADVALKGLRLYPASASDIGTAALECFRAAQQKVLAGDRQLGGQPSLQLVALSEGQPGKPTGPSKERVPVPQSSPISERPVRATSPAINAEAPARVASPLMLSVHQDWQHLSNLNTLVGELISLDNRLFSQNQEHDATLEVLQRCFSRIKQQIMHLYRGSHQVFSDAVPHRMSRGSAIYGKSTGGTGSHLIQFTLEDVLEELSQLQEALGDINLLGQQWQQVLKQHQKTLKQVKTSLLQTQMLPVEELWHQFPRMVRDLCLSEDKAVKLEMTGGQTLIEKELLEKLYDPLVHLVRNAFDHGIESPETRRAVQKSPQATIQISAWNRGQHTYIAVADDGQGIDAKVVKAKAVELGWLTEADQHQLADAQIYQYLFEPNFSTSSQVNQLSGRGMGLYAVQTQVSAMKGTLTVQSQVGKGTTFTLRLPLASTITKLIVFRIDRQTLALPVGALLAIAIASPTTVQRQTNRTLFFWQGQAVPLVTLSTLVKYRHPISSPSDGHPRDLDALEQSTHPVLLLSRGTQVIALKIDEFLFEQDLVIKPFHVGRLAPPHGLCGCTLIGNETLVPVLDGAAMVEKWGQASQLPLPSAAVAAGTALNQRSAATTLNSILVVDDSLTMRNALTTTLGKAGYRIFTAKDGSEALEFMAQNLAIAAIVCDIEMPRMNGLEFLSRVRQQYPKLPFLMLTYRSAQRYRQLAERLGASAYLTKPYLDTELLHVLHDLIEQGYA